MLEEVIKEGKGALAELAGNIQELVKVKEELWTRVKELDNTLSPMLGKIAGAIAGEYGLDVVVKPEEGCGCCVHWKNTGKSCALVEAEIGASLVEASFGSTKALAMLAAASKEAKDDSGGKPKPIPESSRRFRCVKFQALPGWAPTSERGGIGKLARESLNYSGDEGTVLELVEKVFPDAPGGERVVYSKWLEAQGAATAGEVVEVMA